MAAKDILPRVFEIAHRAGSALSPKGELSTEI
jgi:hypothetical protein